MRAPAAEELRGYFADWCRRLEMQPQDWPCRVTGTQMLMTYAGGSLLVGLAVGLPSAILAATGRRLTALVPVLAAGLATAGTSWFTGHRSSQALLGIADTFFGSGGGHSYWQAHGARAVVLDVVLLSAPALAIAFVLRPPLRARPDPLPRHAAWLATFTVAAAIFAVVWIDGHLHGSSGLIADPFSDRWIPAAVMALFAAMLGTDRRWWPWALVPVAVLLSLGPAMAVMSIASRFTALSWFGGAPLLAAVGLVASLWRPIATRFSCGTVAEPPTRSEPRWEVRPVVVLNALAASLLIIAVVAERADPLPIQIAEPLPTYLGERVLAEDVRAKTNLQEAISAMEAYRGEHGTYRGFDAAAGEARCLRWRGTTVSRTRTSWWG